MPDSTIDVSPMSILVVDDNRENLQLLAKVLSDYGYAVRLALDSKLALMSAQINPPDLILLDIMLPGVDGYAVCEALKADPQTSNIPVIFISALYQPFDKVRAFTAGGVDYITKPFDAGEVLARVATHLALQGAQRQLQKQNGQLEREIAERKQAEAALREREERFQLIADTAPVLIWMSDQTALCTFFNKPWLDFTGRTLEQELGDGWAEGVYPDDYERCMDIYLSAFKARQEFTLEYRLRRADSEYRWVVDRGIPRFEGDNFTGYIGSCIDITDRKQAEEALRQAQIKTQAVLDNMQQGFVLIDPDGQILTANPLARHLTKQLLDRPLQDGDSIYNFTQSRPRVEKNIATALSGIRVRHDLAMTTPDGQLCWFDYSYTPVFDQNGQVWAVALVGLDITERKQAEEALRLSEARLHTLFDNIPFSTWMHDREGRMILQNPVDIEWWGDLNSILIQETELPAEIVSEWISQGKRALAGEIVRDEVQRVVQGKLRDFEEIVAPVWVGDKVTGTVGFQIDITERKQAERELRESEARFRRLFDQSPVGVAITTLDCHFLRVNEALCRITGYSEAELLTLRSTDITHPDQLAHTLNYMEQLVAGQVEQYAIDRCYIRKDGSIAWVNLSVRAIRDAAGQPQYLLPVMMDITARKQVEEALRLSEARLRTLVDNIPFSVWMRDREGRMILQNTADIQWWGDLSGQLVSESNFPPDIVSQWVSRQTRAMAGEIVREETQYLIEGEPRFFETIAAPVWVGEQVSGTVGLKIDITERKRQAENKLAESEARYRAIVEDQTELICRFTADGCLTFVNKAYAHYFGKRPEELIGFSLFQLIPEEDQSFAEAAIASYSINKQIDTYEHRVIDGKGEIRWQQWTDRAFFDDQGGLVEFQSVGRDITQRKEMEDELRQHRDNLEMLVTKRTLELAAVNQHLEQELAERKQAEEALRLNEARLQALVDNIPFSVWMRDRHSRVILQNPVDVQWWGEMAETLTQETALPAEVVNEWLDQDRRALAGEIVREEVQQRVEDQVRHFETIVAPVRVGAQVTGTIGVQIDITERKHAEVLLRESEARFRRLFDQSPVGAAIITMDYQYLQVNEALCRIMGYSQAELLTLRFPDITHPDDLALDLELTQQLAAGKIEQHTLDKRYIRKDGSIVWVNLSARVIRDAAGQPLYFLPVIVDITDRKQTEEALRQAQIRTQAILDNVQQAFFLIDANARILLANPIDHYYVKLMTQGQTLEGKSIFSFIPIRDWSSIKRYLAEALSGRPTRFDYTLTMPDNKVYWFDVLFAPVFDQADNVWAVAISGLNITGRKQAEAALRQRVEELAILNQISRTAATVTDLQTTPQVIAEFITALLNAFSTTIVVFDQKEHEGQIVARHTTTSSQAGNLVGQIYSLDTNPAIDQLTESKHAILIIEPQSSALFSPLAQQLLQQDEIYCVLLIPLVARAEVVGYITITRNRSSNVFTSDEVKLAETVAFQVVGAIETARLFYHEQQQRQLAEQRHLVADSLGDILAVLNSNQPLTQILAFIADQTNQLLSSDATAIYTQLDADQPTLLLTAQGNSSYEPAWPTLSHEKAALQQAAATQKPVVASHFNGTSPTLSETETAYQDFLAVPLLLKGEVYGGLILYFAHSQPFSEENLDLAVTFGHQVALALENTRLRDQAREAAVAEERNRIARDLHDAVTQTLFSASLIAAALPHLWSHNPTEAQRNLEKLRLLTRGALAEMRTMLLELRPKTLVESKLSTLLTYLADALTSRARVPVKVTMTGDGDLPPEVQVGIYRIAQEALNNIGKHARANQVVLDLHFQGNGVMLQISDDGCGFETATNFPGHLGIGIMYERAAAIGAALQLSSQSGDGTQVTLRWPAS